jgi:hypothetical protein
MRACWRTKAGYIIAESHGRVMILAGPWAVISSMRALPRKVLALLVEHLGTLPNSASYYVCKGQDAQCRILEEDLATMGELMSQATDAAQYCLPTPLKLNGFRVWQNLETLKTELMAENYTAIVDPEADVSPMAAENGVAWVDGDEAVLVTRAAHSDDGLLERLDGFRWVQ